MSASDALREKGNAAFKSASAPGLGTTLVYARLQSALRFYEDALRAAATAGESAAASKNGGVTRAKMLLLRPPAMEELGSFAGEAGRTLRAFADARAAGAAAGKPSAWLSDVAEAAAGFVFDVTDRCPGWFGKLLPPLPARRSMQSLCAALADAVVPGLAARVGPAAAHGGAGVGAGAGGASARGSARSGAAFGGAGAGGAAARPVDVKLATAVARACVAEGEAVLQQVTLTDAAGAPRKKRDRGSRASRGKAGAGAGAAGGGEESGDESEDEGVAGGAGAAAPRPSGPARKVAQASHAGDQAAIRKGIPLLQEAEPLAELAVALAKAAKEAAPAETAAASAAGDALTDAQDLSRVLFVHSCILASTQARLRGEELLEAAVSENAKGEITVDNVEGLFEAADRYRAAAIAAREADVESEALALASLGRLFRDALRGDAMPDADERALALFKRAIALGLSCAPRTFLGVPWYDEAVTFVNEYREPPPPPPDIDIDIRKEMPEECAAVDAAAAKGAAALLAHIYSKHPPRHVSGKDMTMGSTKAEDMKKTVLQAITHFHPDKQEHAPTGASAAAARKVAVWRAFSSFIVKHLNHFYDMLKT